MELHLLTRDRAKLDRIGDAYRIPHRRNRSLMIAFNRRYAPDYAALRRLPRDLIVMEKHRVDLPAAPDR